MLKCQVPSNQQDGQAEKIHLLKGVGKEHVSFLILILTFHHQLSQVDMVVPSQVQDVMLHRVVVARTNHHCLDLVCFLGSQPVICFFPRHRQEHLSVS